MTNSHIKMYRVKHMCTGWIEYKEPFYCNQQVVSPMSSEKIKAIEENGSIRIKLCHRSFNNQKNSTKHNSIKNNANLMSRFGFKYKICKLSLVLGVRLNLALFKKIWLHNYCCMKVHKAS